MQWIEKTVLSWRGSENPALPLPVYDPVWSDATWKNVEERSILHSASHDCPGESINASPGRTTASEIAAELEEVCRDFPGTDANDRVAVARTLCLSVIAGPHIGMQVFLAGSGGDNKNGIWKHSMRIGRHRDCHIRLQKDRILLPHHLLLTTTETGWEIENCSSQNSVLHNYRRLLEPAYLKDGSVIQMGQSILLASIAHWV